jgi:hypothetical protein
MERSLLRFLKSRKKPSNGMSELTLRSPYGPFRRLESPLAFRAQKPLVSLLDAFGVILIGNRSMVRAVISTVPSKCPEGPDHHPRNPHYSWGLPAFLVPINLSLKLNLNQFCRGVLNSRPIPLRERGPAPGYTLKHATPAASCGRGFCSLGTKRKAAGTSTALLTGYKLTALLLVAGSAATPERSECLWTSRVKLGLRLSTVSAAATCSGGYS